jgi:hypothetical protein
MKPVVVSIMVALALVTALPHVGFAQGTDGKVHPWDNNVTWKVNVAKSKYNPPELTPKSWTVKREPFEDGFKVTSDQVDAQGKAIHTVYVGKYDGRDRPVQGSEPPATQAYRLIENGYEIVNKVDGKVTITSRLIMSHDGNTITHTVTGKNPQGRTSNHTIIWERQ